MNGVCPRGVKGVCGRPLVDAEAEPPPPPSQAEPSRGGPGSPGPRGRHPQTQRESPLVETATESGSTHPTGMNSCFGKFFLKNHIEENECTVEII